MLICCALLCLCGCSSLPEPPVGAAAGPDLRLLTMPVYEAQTVPQAATAQAATLRVDLWLDASQLMGGMNPSDESMYPHYSRRYREGGFHYRYQNAVGLYESVLCDMLAAADGSRVRVLRVGNERLPDDYLLGTVSSSAGAEQLRSFRRDMLTMAIDPLPTVFSAFSAEKMQGGFYELGTPMLNRLSALDASLLENPGKAQAMSAALDGQIAAIAAGEPGGLAAVANDTDYPLLYALENLDASRVSVITCDPAAIRRLTMLDANGESVLLLKQLLERRGLFDEGLSVGLYAFTLDYMGQMASFATVDFSEPLLWGRMDFSANSRESAGALPMPRTLLALVVGAPAQVDAYTNALNERLDADAALRELRGPRNGQLTYAFNGQTVVQEPFGFSYESTVIRRPAVETQTNQTPGATLSASRGTVDVQDNLATVTVSPNEDGAHDDVQLTIAFPAAAMPDGASIALDNPANAGVSVTTAVLMDRAVPNQPDAYIAPNEQVIALRDTLYVFSLRDGLDTQSPFSLRGITCDGQTLTVQVDISGELLRAGRYRLLVSTDLSGEQVSWTDVPWAASLNTSITNAQIAQWESFSQLITRYDRDSELIPKQFQHAWGAVSERGYHNIPIPSIPPVWLAPGLEELIAQLRDAANITRSPHVRYTLDIFVTGDSTLAVQKGAN